MSGAAKRQERREYCKQCDGNGSRFLLTHRTNPSAKHVWTTCDHCGGDGLEPLPVRDEDEEIQW